MGKSKNDLKDFAKQAKEERNWKNKQYQEREKNFGESEGYSDERRKLPFTVEGSK